MKAGSFKYVVLCSQNYLLLDLLQKTKKQKQRQKQEITFKFRQGTTHVGSSYLLTKHDTIAVKDVRFLIALSLEMGLSLTKRRLNVADL